ncbi:MAG: protein translocase subunit SecD [Patescibacteria group bacterium]
MKFKNFFTPKGRGKLRWTIFFIAVLFIISAGYTATESYNGNLDSLNESVKRVPGLESVTLQPVSLPQWLNPTFRLGLDLKGGTHLVYEADLSKISFDQKDAAMEGVREVIERRVNAFGVAEPLVQTVKVGDSYRLIVELAGVSDVSEAIKMIGDTPLLEFKEQDIEPKQQELTDAQKKELGTYNADARKKAEDLLKKALAKDADFTALGGTEVGWVNRTSPNSNLLTAVEGLKLQEVKNDILQSDEGYSIVKLLETRDAKEVLANHILICYKGASRCEQETPKSEAREKSEELKNQATPENFVELAKANSTEPGADTRGGDLGWFAPGQMVKAFEDAVFPLPKNTISDIVETEFGFHLIWKRDERTLPEYRIARMLVDTKTKEDILPPPEPWKDTGLSGKQLARANVDFNNPTGVPQVAIDFNDEGKKLFAEITRRNVGKPIAVFLDGQPISIPTVQQAIEGGNAVITGDFSLKEAKLLAQRLNTGALPVPVQLISQQTIGPSLGQESLNKSMVAGLYGFLFVVIFMILFYRLPGLLAVLALLIYTSIVLAIFKVWPVTLSLAGIAGFILSVGMAVDANVLIFERMKEELRAGKGLSTSITEGFKRAWTSIRDSNVASLITCFILFWFSASLIKGFALTLAIGILISIFSAVAVTRVFLKVVAGWRWGKNRWLFCAKDKKEV